MNPSYVPVLIDGDGRAGEGLPCSTPEQAMHRALDMYRELPGPLIRVYVETRARWSVETTS